MSKMVQVRNVPDAVHRRLKARAAMLGMPLSDYLLAELRRIAERPSREEMMARLGTASRPDLHPSPADLVRQERDVR